MTTPSSAQHASFCTPPPAVSLGSGILVGARTSAGRWNNQWVYASGPDDGSGLQSTTPLQDQPSPASFDNPMAWIAAAGALYVRYGIKTTDGRPRQLKLNMYRWDRMVPSGLGYDVPGPGALVATLATLEVGTEVVNDVVYVHEGFVHPFPTLPDGTAVMFWLEDQDPTAGPLTGATELTVDSYLTVSEALVPTNVPSSDGITGGCVPVPLLGGPGPPPTEPPPGWHLAFYAKFRTPSALLISRAESSGGFHALRAHAFLGAVTIPGGIDLSRAWGARRVTPAPPHSGFMASDPMAHYPPIAGVDYNPAVEFASGPSPDYATWRKDLTSVALVRRDPAATDQWFTYVDPSIIGVSDLIHAWVLRDFGGNQTVVGDSELSAPWPYQGAGAPPDVFPGGDYDVFVPSAPVSFGTSFGGFDAWGGQTIEGFTPHDLEMWVFYERPDDSFDFTPAGAAPTPQSKDYGCAPATAHPVR